MSRAPRNSRPRRLHRVLGRLFYPAFRVGFFNEPFALKSTTRRPSAPSLLRRARASALRSFPCSFAISARIPRTSSTIGSRHMNLRLHQFFRRADDWPANRRPDAASGASPCQPAFSRAAGVWRARRDIDEAPRSQSPNHETPALRRAPTTRHWCPACSVRSTCLVRHLEDRTLAACRRLPVSHLGSSS